MYDRVLRLLQYIIKGLNTATTVIAAFNEFMKGTVNLKKADTDDARASRDWLIGKMNDVEKNDKDPVSYPAILNGFRSFARSLFFKQKSGIRKYPAASLSLNKTDVKSSANHFLNSFGNIFNMGFQSKVPRIQQFHYRIRVVPFEGLRTRWNKEWIIFSPDNK